MGNLTGKTVVLGVTGGIAAYKACDIVSRLKKEGACVRVVMTQNACHFVTPNTFETLSGNKVYTEVFHDSWEIGHVSLAREASLLLIAPATANIMAKMACGIADDMLSTTCLAMPGDVPVLIAPAMNTQMWKHPATQANIKTLTDRGVHFVGPESGHLACGDTDIGRMSEPVDIVKAVCSVLCPGVKENVLSAEEAGTDASTGVSTETSIGAGYEASIGAGNETSIGVSTETSIGAGNEASIGASTEEFASKGQGICICGAVTGDLSGHTVLVTAGPTREMLDPVRFISNRSSGKMGYAIAEAARDRGADVTLVSGPVALEAPQGIRVVRITSTQDLYDAVVSRSEEMDIIIQAAAPADFTPETVAQQKIKKTGEDLVVRFRSTPDIAMELGKRKRSSQVLVAFAAETGNLTENARKKLLRKNADFVVANDVTQPGAGFGVDTNCVTFVDAQGITPMPLMGKREVADAILDRIINVMHI